MITHTVTATMRAHRSAAILLIGLAALLTAGCTRPIRSWELSDPIMYANQDGGCVAGAAACRYNTGLLLAVWADGRVLRAESADTVGLRYILGSSTANRSEVLLTTVAGIDGAPNYEVPPGSASHRIVVATPAGLPRFFHFPIPVEHDTQALVEEQLIEIMQIELENVRRVHWAELPRFDSPVVGNWRSVHFTP